MDFLFSTNATNQYNALLQISKFDRKAKKLLTKLNICLKSLLDYDDYNVAPYGNRLEKGKKQAHGLVKNLNGSLSKNIDHESRIVFYQKENLVIINAIAHYGEFLKLTKIIETELDFVKNHTIEEIKEVYHEGEKIKEEINKLKINVVNNSKLETKFDKIDQNNRLEYIFPLNLYQYTTWASKDAPGHIDTILKNIINFSVAYSLESLDTEQEIEKQTNHYVKIIADALKGYFNKIASFNDDTVMQTQIIKARQCLLNDSNFINQPNNIKVFREKLCIDLSSMLVPHTCQKYNTSKNFSKTSQFINNSISEDLINKRIEQDLKNIDLKNIEKQNIKTQDSNTTERKKPDTKTIAVSIDPHDFERIEALGAFFDRDKEKWVVPNEPKVLDKVQRFLSPEETSKRRVEEAIACQKRIKEEKLKQQNHKKKKKNKGR